MTIDSGRLRRFRRTIRFTANELAMLTAAAAKAGLCISGYVRCLVTKTKPLRAARRPLIEHSVLARILEQLGKIGSNLNQIAHAANAGGHRFVLMTTHERELARALVDLRECGRRLLAALGRRDDRP